MFEFATLLHIKHTLFTQVLLIHSESYEQPILSHNEPVVVGEHEEHNPP